MNDCIEEIKQYLQRKPRLNVVLVKSSPPVPKQELVNGLNCEVVDLPGLILQGKLKAEEITGYMSLINFIKDMSDKASKDTVLIHVDLLLSGMDKQKRLYFFQTVLQKNFRKSVILVTSLFSEEVPETADEEFNYAKSVQWR